MGFQMIGIIILLAFYACYFIKMIVQHQKGIKTNQMGKGKVGSVKWIEMSMKVITCLVPVVEVVSIFLNTHFFMVSVRIIGIFVGSIGVAVFLISMLTMQDNWRAGVPNTDKTELVTKGIYQISRNPAFLGFDFVYIGIAMMFFNGVLFLASCMAILILHIQIVKVEETFLAEAFGDEYLCYKKKVCRYLGRKSRAKEN